MPDTNRWTAIWISELTKTDIKKKINRRVSGGGQKPVSIRQPWYMQPSTPFTSSPHYLHSCTPNKNQNIQSSFQKNNRNASYFSVENNSIEKRTHFTPVFWLVSEKQNFWTVNIHARLAFPSNEHPPFIHCTRHEHFSFHKIKKRKKKIRKACPNFQFA